MPAAPVGTPRAIRPAAAASAVSRRLSRPARALAILAILAAPACSRVPVRAEERRDGPVVHACRQVIPADAVVRWVEPEARTERDTLARWCDTIGPILIQPLAVKAAAPIDRLAVVTWNVHVGGGDIADFVARLRRGEFTGGTAIEHFVLLLQEAYRRDPTVPARIPRGFPAPSRIAVNPAASIWCVPRASLVSSELDAKATSARRVSAAVLASLISRRGSSGAAVR